jgi:hypothetical protein
MKLLLVYTIGPSTVCNCELTVSGHFDPKLSSKALFAIRKHLREFHGLAEDAPVVILGIVELSMFEPETIKITAT